MIKLNSNFNWVNRMGENILNSVAIDIAGSHIDTLPQIKCEGKYILQKYFNKKKCEKNINFWFSMINSLEYSTCIDCSQLYGKLSITIINTELYYIMPQDLVNVISEYI